MPDNTPAKRRTKDIPRLPAKILEAVRLYCGGYIALDPATTGDNPTKSRTFFTPDMDGLHRSWKGFGPIFVNPPRAGRLRDWTTKILHEINGGAEILALLPISEIKQVYYQEVARRAQAVCWIQRRVSLGNSYALALWGFNPIPSLFRRCFRPLGLVRELQP